MQPKAIAIIGAGFSGTMVAVHLLRTATQPVTVVLVDPKPDMGRGVAYGTAERCHLLNVPVGKMSAFPDDPDHFLRWIEQQPDWSDSASAQAFAPRMVYGRYIQAVLAEAEAIAPPHIRLIRLVDQAVSVTPHGQGAIVEFKHGESLTVDRVVLALGNFPSSPLPIADVAFYQSDRYLPSPWLSNEVSALQNDAALLLIGSGLTALDVVMTLQQQGHRGRIYMVSRRGLLPQSHAPSFPRQLSCPDSKLSTGAVPWRYEGQAEPALIDQDDGYNDAGMSSTKRRIPDSLKVLAHAGMQQPSPNISSVINLQASNWESVRPSTSFLESQPFRFTHSPQTTLSLSLRQLVRQIRQAVQATAAQGGDWRNVIDSLRLQTQTLWQQLSLKERKQFLRHVRPYWDTHRHCIAPAIAERIAHLRQAGQLTVQAGRVLAYTETATGVDVTIRQRCSGTLTQLQVDRVVNCTGPECNYQKVPHPLVKMLLQSGLIQADALGLGVQVAPNGALLQADMSHSDWLYTLGAAQKGSLWETTAVPELRQQAIALAQELLCP